MAWGEGAERLSQTAGVITEFTVHHPPGLWSVNRNSVALSLRKHTGDVNQRNSKTKSIFVSC